MNKLYFVFNQVRNRTQTWAKIRFTTTMFCASPPTSRPQMTNQNFAYKRSKKKK